MTMDDLSIEEHNVVLKMRADRCAKQSEQKTREDIQAHLATTDRVFPRRAFDDCVGVNFAGEPVRPPLTEADAMADLTGQPRPPRFRSPSEVLGIKESNYAPMDLAQKYIAEAITQLRSMIPTDDIMRAREDLAGVLERLR